MDISARAASHSIKATTTIKKKGDFSIPQIVSDILSNTGLHHQKLNLLFNSINHITPKSC